MEEVLQQILIPVFSIILSIGCLMSLSTIRWLSENQERVTYMCYILKKDKHPMIDIKPKIIIIGKMKLGIAVITVLMISASFTGIFSSIIGWAVQGAIILLLLAYMFLVIIVGMALWALSQLWLKWPF